MSPIYNNRTDHYDSAMRFYEKTLLEQQTRNNVKALLDMAILSPEICEGINFEDAVVRDVVLADPTFTVAFYGVLSGDRIGDLANRRGVPLSCIKVPK